VGRDDLQALFNRLAKPGALNRRYTVLAVDDDPEIIQMLREMLPASRFTLYATCDGEQAVHLARAQAPDVVLLDLLMPGLSGLEVLDALRNDVQTVDIPVIVLTAIDLTPQERRILDDNAQGLMRKTTLTPQSILAELHRLETLHK
jgi:CheY-like chemotaxis protein